MLILSLITSLCLGVALAWVYKYRTVYTKEFVTTLIILPSLLAIIIFLVNGSLGTSVAVAGTFSLIRFRSAAGGSRELLSLFLAMTIGLSTGMGYLILAILSILFFLSIWFSLEKFFFFNNGQTFRFLTIDVSKKEVEVKQVFSTILNNYCSNSDLVSLKTSQNGSQLRLSYEVDLKSDGDDVNLMQNLLNIDHATDESLTKRAKKRKIL